MGQTECKWEVDRHCSLRHDNGSKSLRAFRCLSATHVAQGSARVIAQAFAMGEASGVLAAKSADSGRIPRAISVGGIQDELKRHGAILEA